MDWTREIERDYGLDRMAFEIMVREANALEPYCSSVERLALSVADSMNRLDDWLDDPEHPVWCVAREVWHDAARPTI